MGFGRGRKRPGAGRT